MQSAPSPTLANTSTNGNTATSTTSTGAAAAKLTDQVHEERDTEDEVPKALAKSFMEMVRDGSTQATSITVGTGQVNKAFGGDRTKGSLTRAKSGQDPEYSMDKVQRGNIAVLLESSPRDGKEKAKQGSGG